MSDKKENTRLKDNGGRLIFENATLCSQFLREYTGMELFKDIEASDVEDMTERYLPMFSEERDSDVVKKIRLHGSETNAGVSELFIVALIEHKSSVDYNVSMQMLHYMSYIWEEYEKTMEAQKKGITKRKDFRYPPILPIVYYEDEDIWTSPIRLHDRIFLSELIKDYVPDYEYYLFRLQDCEDADLIDRKDEISLIMLINKLRRFSDFRNLHLPNDYFEDIAEKTTGDVLIVLAKLIESYLRNINLPDDEIYDLTDRIKEGDMNRLFEHFEGYDIQKVRKESRSEGREEGREEGRDILLITQIAKKLERGKSPEAIADEVETSIETVNEVIDAINSVNGEDFDAQKVLEAWKKHCRYKRKV